MSDMLTDRLATSVKTHTPFVMKYIPYGALSEVHAYATCQHSILFNSRSRCCHIFLDVRSRISRSLGTDVLQRNGGKRLMLFGNVCLGAERERFQRGMDVLDGRPYCR
jgi:hypothetical protein